MGSPLSDRPPHTITQSTLAPTAEFTRIFLLAMVMRYLPRGLFGEMFHARTPDFVKTRVNKFINWSFLNRMAGRITKELNENASLVRRLQRNPKALTDELNLENQGEAGALYRKLRPYIRSWRGNGSEEIPHIIKNAEWKNGKFELHHDTLGRLRNVIRASMDDMAYSLSLGIGSGWLSLRYSKMVRSDIKNIFREAVAYEKDIPQDQVTFRDIEHSDNTIVQRTVANYREKMWQRFGTDALFFAAAPFKSEKITDIALGAKGLQLFSETWARKTTMFEDLVTFINNKINPRNGLGQPITVGEVFDLYQHYADNFQPDKMFNNVVVRDVAEGQVWAKSEPVFRRITELLNHSYAYKHNVAVGDTGKPDADFALPKFIYLLGHDLIRPRHPEQTLAAIEIANKFGIPAVKNMQAMLAKGASLEQVIQRYPVTINVKPESGIPEDKNGVIAKGSTMQLDRADRPSSKILTDSILTAEPNLAQLARNSSL